MGNEEPTDHARIRRIIDEEVQLPRTGIITKVYEHTQTDDRWNFHVDVRLGPDKHPRKVPVAVPAPELAVPPRSVDHADGPDLALVQYLQDNETERPIVTNILYNNEDRPPLGTEGIFRLRRGGLYVEMAPAGEWARISQKSSDDGTPTAKVEIAQDGSVTIEGDTDVIIKGNATVDGDDVTVGETDYKIVKNGTDGTGIINFKTN